MPQGRLTRFVLPKETELVGLVRSEKYQAHFTVKKVSREEVCPRCATLSRSKYDRRTVVVRDAPIRGHGVFIKIEKHRYYCKPCRKPFTEPIDGVLPKKRTTQRFRRDLLWACENFADLTKVRRAYNCSSAFIYRVLYEQLELKLRQYQYPWPRVIGIDEHFFSRRNGFSEFATVITDMTHKRLRAVVHGKTRHQLAEQLSNIEGRENVRWVAMDLSDTYKGFIFNHFPNAQIVADKFHVLRLLTPHLIKRRKDFATDRMSSKAKRWLTMSSKNLDYFDRKAIWKFLADKPQLKELYDWKERMFALYRIKGYERAKKALEYMLIDMEKSVLPEIKTLKRTLTRWKQEVLNYFIHRLTNARTEGFNNVAKLVQKRAYGYKSFRNYRLRLLSACAF